MKLNHKTADLIGDLEYCIGTECYNPNSYNGWTGEEGCEFRYPVTYCQKEEDIENHCATKTRGIISNLEPSCVNTVKYTFGSNHLFIGNGIARILEELEERFDLDFNQLIESEQEIRLQKYQKRLALYNEIKEMSLPKDVYLEVGRDLPAGSYMVMNADISDLYCRNTVFIYSNSFKLLGSKQILGRRKLQINLEEGQHINVTRDSNWTKAV